MIVVEWFWWKVILNSNYGRVFYLDNGFCVFFMVYRLRENKDLVFIGCFDCDNLSIIKVVGYYYERF